MMQAVYNSNGDQVAWLHDYLLFDTDFRNLGHVQSEYVFNQTGNHIGQFSAGYFWNLKGEAFSFIASASELLPLPSIEAPPPAALFESPLAPLPHLPEFALTKIPVWSQQTWPEIVGVVV